MVGPRGRGALVIEPVRVRARAKLNLGLRVLGLRDDGYHELESFTVPLTEPHDDLVLSALPEGHGVHMITGGTDAGVPADDSNLAAQAAHVLLELVPEAPAIEIALHKGIPAGAGLGGGSADAAAVLVGVRALLALDVDDASLRKIGERLGSDVPFCLGRGASLMRGRGERLEPGVAPSFRLLVAVPDARCSTPDVYRAWDDLGGPGGRTVSGPSGATFRNDLEPAAWRVNPGLDAFRRLLEHVCGRDALMAGSGSAYAVLYDEDETPGRDVAEVRDRTGAMVTSSAAADACVTITR